MSSTFSYPIFFAVLLLSFASGADAQSQTEIHLRASNGDALRVEQVSERSTTVQSLSNATLIADASSQHSLCETPCRFVLDAPMELRVQNSTLVLSPNGGVERYEVAPARLWLYRLSRVSIVAGGSAIFFGGFTTYLHRNNNLDIDGFRVGGNIALGIGIPLLIASIIGLVRSRSRVTRVDSFEF